MVIKHHVHGYDEFTKLITCLEDSGQTIHILFCGGVDEVGVNWCPHCTRAEPIISEALKLLAEQSHFIHVDVGELAFWKDPDCPFRKDVRLNLVYLPTLLRWKSYQRLDSDNCCNADLVEMLFGDEN